MISVAGIIAQDPVGMKQLRAARALALPDWCIAAGFVRNRVWDHLHGISPPREPPDIDVLYYDAADLSKEREAAYEKRLDDLLACFADDAVLSDGYLNLPDRPGIGFEAQNALYKIMRELAA